MNILLVSSYLPYPLHSGGQVRLYNLIKELSSKHKITLICEKRTHQTKSDIEAVQKICQEVITVDRKKQWTLQNVVRSGASSHSFLITGHTQSEMQEKIQKILQKESFDLIHVETFYVLQNVPKTEVPIVLVEHNIEYQVYQRFVDRAPWAIRQLLQLDILKMKQEETQSWERATALVAVSQDDKLIMEKAGFSSTVVSNGVNTRQFSFQKKKATQAKKILFLGDFSWMQNRDSVKFILEQIWPNLISKRKSQNAKEKVKLWIVGRKIPESVRRVTDDPDIFFDEASSSKSTPEIFQEADVLLAPIRVGGGTSYKILESMSCGTPVVTMPLSAKAIAAQDEKHLLVGKTAQELAAKTDKLLHDKALYNKVSTGGRALIEEHYTWKAIGKILDSVYQKVVE